MGGMFTILKVRENLPSYNDPGWYVNPPGTQARPASPELLRENNIVVNRIEKHPANTNKHTHDPGK
jgi:hypothetical protein